MFANGFDQDPQPDDFSDYSEQWEDDPTGWDDSEYPESVDPDYPSSPPNDNPTAIYPSTDYLTDDYPSTDYPSNDYPTPNSLPKFLFLCTILACLILAVGLSLVTIQVSSTGSLAQAQTAAGSQPGAEAAMPAGPDNSNCSVSQRFPDSIRRWCGLITQYASKHGLPPNLVAALIWQESGGNPVAYSRSGAVGLMQVMPSDGLAASFQCLSGPCFSTRPSTDELKDPEFNVSYGTRMLAGLVGKTGNLREALKSYGPANVGYYYADKVLGIYQTYGN